MIDANTLLNPEYGDAELRAYAFLSTQYKRGVRSPIDCLQPFVVQGIASFSGEQLDWRKVREFLKQTYRLTIPFYMLERMEGGLLSVGALKRSELARVLVCQNARPTLESDTVDFSTSDIDRLGEALHLYAKSRGVDRPITADHWSDLVIPFFQSRPPSKDKASANVRGVLLSNPKSFDFTIIADFIMQEFINKTANYRVIEQVYYGVLVSEFLTQIETTGNKASFKGLSIVYDGPVILRMLGCSGKILQDATLDLHETLRDLGCRTYYFRHTYDEVAASIEAILKSHEYGTPMFRETQEAIARRETSISEIYNIKADLDLRLSGTLGLVEHAAGYDNRKEDDFQIDEKQFKEHLKKYGRWGQSGSQAADRDGMSLALVMRLRGGRQVRDVSKSGFVFITHNVRLAVNAKEFLRQEGHLSEGSVWPIMTVGQMSTIAWVVNESFNDNAHISKELIASCYAAALPDEDFDQALKDTLAKTDPKMAHDLYTNAFVVQSIRQVALSQTAGHTALIRTLSTAEILAEAEKVREEAIKTARSQERDEVQTELVSAAVRRLEERATMIAQRVSGLIMIIFLIGAIYLAAQDVGILGGHVNPKRPVAWLLFLLAAYGAADLFGYVSPASLRGILTRMLTRPVRWIQNSLT